MSTGPSGSATGYLTALFRDGTLASKSDSELLEHAVIRKSSIGHIASAEAIALMEITMKNMMIGRVVFAIGSVLAVGFCTLGAAVVAYAALAHGRDFGRSRIADPGVATPEPSPREERAAQAAGQRTVPVVQKQARSGQKRRADSQPIVILVETVDSQGKPLSFVRVGTSVSYAPPRTGLQSAMIQSATNELGRAQSARVDVTPGEHAQSADIWAYKPGRALRASACRCRERWRIQYDSHWKTRHLEPFERWGTTASPSRVCASFLASSNSAVAALLRFPINGSQTCADHGRERCSGDHDCSAQHEYIDGSRHRARYCATRARSPGT